MLLAIWLSVLFEVLAGENDATVSTHEVVRMEVFAERANHTTVCDLLVALRTCVTELFFVVMLAVKLALLCIEPE